MTSGVAFPGYSDVAIAPDGDFMVVWQEENGTPSFDVRVRIFSGDETPQGAAFLLNASTIADSELPSVAARTDGGFVVAWQGHDGSDNGILGRHVSPAGAPEGGEFLVNVFTQDQQDEPAVATWPGGEFVVVWTAQNSYDCDHDGALGQVFDADGNAVGSEFQVDDAGYEVDVATHDQGFVVSFLSFDYDVGVRRFDRNGVPLGNPVTASGPFGGYTIPIRTEYAVTNAGVTYRHCSQFDPIGAGVIIDFKEIAGGTGRKLVARNGAPAACP